MNGFWVAAGLVCLLTVGFHVFAGGVRVVRPMLASSDLNQTMKAVLYGCWHAFTLLYIGVACAFIWAARAPEADMLALAGTILAGGLAAMSAIVIVRFSQRFRRLPHWLLFTITALLGALGALG